MKSRKFIVIAASLMCLLPMLVGFIMFNELPAKIPSHFDFNGVADAYMDKTLLIVGLPLFFAVITLITGFLVNEDPKKQNQAKILYILSLIFLPILSNITVNLSYLIALGYELNISNIILLLLGIMFILIGNYLPKVKQNYTMGVQLPWTLNDEDNWNKTHRLTGFLWVIGGFIFFIVPFFPVLLFINLGLLLVVPIIYSYTIYKKKLRG